MLGRVLEVSVTKVLEHFFLFQSIEKHGMYLTMWPEKPVGF